MDPIQNLYQEIIVDHYKSPRNFGALEAPDRHAEGYNPLCGDKISLDLDLEGDRVVEARFDGSGCAISTASASLLTEAVRGKTVAEARRLFGDFRELLTGGGPLPDDAFERFGKLAALGGVRAYPMRVKCATLAWHTLHAALEDREAPVSTE